MALVEHAGEVEQWSIVVVYDAKSGDIVHKHECVSLRGGTHPSKQMLEKDALEQASRAGRDTTKVSLLHVDPKDLNIDAHYKVDTKTRTLVEVQQPKRKARRDRKR
jgi:hypothetical protein